MNRSILLVALGIVLIAGACRPQRTAPSGGRGGSVLIPRPTPTPTPTHAPETFDAPGIRLSHPAAWHRTFSEDRELYLELPDGASVLSLDIPELPPHVPGLIPLGLVVNGYVADLKKQHPGIVVGKPLALKVAGAYARRVRSQWDANGARCVEDAVLTVRGDRVYIFRANAESADERAARDALEQLLASVTWE